MRVQTLLSTATSALLLAFGASPIWAQGGHLEFITTEATLPNARQGDEYSHNIAGLVQSGNDASPITFSKRNGGPDWLSVSPDGVLSGTPGDNASDAVVSVRATAGGSSDTDETATAAFTIPVRPSGAPLLDQLQVLSLNMWHGGTQVNSYHEKQVRFLATSGADVVGLQEDQDGRYAPRLAEALGWHHWASNGSTSTLSKYPVAAAHGVINASSGVRVALDGDAQQVELFNVHLGYTPYGPYDFCFDNMTVEAVLEREAESGRTPQVTDTLAFMEQGGFLERADEVPVLLVGDFNAPSHLDWIEELSERNCGVAGVPWPTSVLPEGLGLVDSFRTANPDPVEVEGVTWSPIYPWNDVSELPEPQDRIDFVYHKGKGLKLLSSRTLVVGEPEDMPDHEDNEWTTDHAAVLTVYELVSSE